jgi:hypothetical protein
MIAAGCFWFVFLITIFVVIYNTIDEIESDRRKQNTIRQLDMRYYDISLDYLIDLRIEIQNLIKAIKRHPIFYEEEKKKVRNFNRHYKQIMKHCADSNILDSFKKNIEKRIYEINCNFKILKELVENKHGVCYNDIIKRKEIKNAIIKKK